MKNILTTILAAGLFVLTGCFSTTPTHVDKGPIHAATFNFFHPGPLPPAAAAENRQQMHALIQEAINNALTAKGLSEVADGGDITVAYLVIVGNNASTTSINDYFGYGDQADALLDKAQTAYTDNNRRTYFEAGTLVIDLIDSKTHKLLLRNYVVRPILNNPSTEVRQAHIQEAVDAALKELRIEH
jgi:hypothetical protein